MKLLPQGGESRLKLSKNPLRWAFSPFWHRPAGRVSPHFLRKMAAGRGVFDHFHTENGQKRLISKIAGSAILTFLTSWGGESRLPTVSPVCFQQNTPRRLRSSSPAGSVFNLEKKSRTRPALLRGAGESGPAFQRADDGRNSQADSVFVGFSCVEADVRCSDDIRKLHQPVVAVA